MAIVYTPDQQKVINYHGKNILVSAAAGSGKTAVLVERIVRMVSEGEHPADIDRLLVVTFTNMAAGELRERIGLAIGRRLEADPENGHLQRQMTLIHNAQITTIDSFCLFILRNHFHLIGLDPGFRVADEGELKLLAKDVLGELLEDRYQEGNPDFLECVEYFATGSRDKQLEEYITQLYDFAMSFPWPEDWLQARKADYQVGCAEEMGKSDWGQFLLGYLRELAAGCAEELEKGIGICEEPDGPYMYTDLLHREFHMIAELRKAGSLEECAALWESTVFGRLSPKKDEAVSAAKREQVQDIRKQVKTAWKETGERFFQLPLEQAAEQMSGINEAAEVLLELAMDYKKRLDAAKREKNIIDFGDMEHFALMILLEKTSQGMAPTAAARELREYFTDILIDEYQDSNMVQELLLESISGEAEGRFNRFMVGDVKQSIYKFRLARPEIFMEKYDCYPLEEDDGAAAGKDGFGTYGESPLAGCGDTAVEKHMCRHTGGNCRRIDLSRNFRSRTEILDSVNYVFSRIMRKSLGGVEYDRRAALYPGAEYPERVFEAERERIETVNETTNETANETTNETTNETANETTNKTKIIDEIKIEIINEANKTEMLLYDPHHEGTEELYDGESPKEMEARMIARRIKELKANFEVTDKETGKLRPVGYRDMVILLRTNEGWDEVFRKVLEEEGIPAHTASKTGYFETTEIRTVLQVIRVLDNPLQDIPLFGVLKSYFGGFGDEEIARVRAECRGNASLYQKLLMYHSLLTQEGKQNHTTERIGKFMEWIETFRRKAVYVPIQNLLKELMIDSGYYHYIAVQPVGEQRIANLEMLMAKAESFAQTSYYGLFHFVRYIEQLEKYDVDYGEANTLDEQADIIRLMSIHKSKGLEFPVCFVAGLAKGFNMQDSRGGLVMDADLGIGVDYVDTVLRVQNRSLRKNAVSLKMKLDSLGEELRVLYVAMTRAKEKLILSGVAKRPEVAGGTTDRLSFLKLAGAGSYLDYLLPVIMGEDGAAYFSVRIWTREQLFHEEVKESTRRSVRQKDLLMAAFGEEVRSSEQKDKMTLMSERLARTYSRKDLAGLYTKTTVSELKKAEPAGYTAPEESDGNVFAIRMFEEPEIIPYIPLFMKGKEDMTGTVRGSAYHKVMELLRFQEIPGGFNPEETQTKEPLKDQQQQQLKRQQQQQLKRQQQQQLEQQQLEQQQQLKQQLRQQLKQQLKQAYDEGKLSKEYLDAIRYAKIVDFLETPLALRMIHADREGKLHKEQPFVIGLGADRLNKEFSPQETILIQGIIDVFFEEDGELVVMDYKTDAVERPEELLKRYRKQLEYYGEALEQLTGKKVKEKIIYSFSLNQEIRIVNGLESYFKEL